MRKGDSTEEAPGNSEIKQKDKGRKKKGGGLFIHAMEVKKGKNNNSVIKYSFQGKSSTENDH